MESRRTIEDAVVLAAGIGSRLGASSGAVPKPLVRVGGRPIISYTIEALSALGARKFHFVVGANATSLLPALRELLPAGAELHAIENTDWQKQNGVSVLCAEHHVTRPFVLTMGDHLFEPELLATLIARSDLADANLAVDRKLSAIFDMDDAMKVRTQDGRVIQIAKTLAEFDAVDTGAFVCSPDIFRYLRRAQNSEGDCSLADGVRGMAADCRVHAIDIGGAWWQDVDTAEMLREAEAQVARLVARSGGLADAQRVELHQ